MLNFIQDLLSIGPQNKTHFLTMANAELAAIENNLNNNEEYYYYLNDFDPTSATLALFETVMGSVGISSFTRFNIDAKVAVKILKDFKTCLTALKTNAKDKRIAKLQQLIETLKDLK